MYAGEIMLRIAVLRKEMGLVDMSMQMCNSITSEPYSDIIRANALCLKVLEIKGYILTSPYVNTTVSVCRACYMKLRRSFPRQK